MKEDNNILNHNNECLTSDTLIKYIKGELSGMERNLVERHISSCEMCSDELEGLSIMQHPEKVEEISNELDRKIDSLTAKPERKIPYLGFYARIAASIIVILGISTIIYFTTFRKTPSFVPNYALMDAKESISPQDSSNDMMQKDIAGEKKMENLELAQDGNSKEKRTLERENSKPKENVKYVAPVVVDSLKSDEAIAEVKEDEISSIVVDELVVAEAQQVASESIVQPTPVSSEKKSALAVGGLARKEKVSTADKSIRAIFGMNYNKRKELAIRLFSKQKYKEALAALNELLNEYPTNDTTLFYTSMCNYHLNRFNETIGSISVLAKNKQSEFYNQAKWYYALALIGAERKEDAVTVLEQILLEDSPFKHEAKNKLQKLKGN